MYHLLDSIFGSALVAENVRGIINSHTLPQPGRWACSMAQQTSVQSTNTSSWFTFTPGMLRRMVPATILVGTNQTRPAEPSTTDIHIPSLTDSHLFIRCVKCQTHDPMLSETVKRQWTGIKCNGGDQNCIQGLTERIHSVFDSWGFSVDQDHRVRTRGTSTPFARSVAQTFEICEKGSFVMS